MSVGREMLINCRYHLSIRGAVAGESEGVNRRCFIGSKQTVVPDGEGELGRGGAECRVISEVNNVVVLQTD